MTSVILRDFRLFLAVLILALAGNSIAQTGPITGRLSEALVHSSPDDYLPVVVLMDPFPDRDGLLVEARKLTRENRRRFVVRRMKEFAGRTQESVHAHLSGAPERARDLRVLWGVNGVALEATPQLIGELAELEEVRWILLDKGFGHPEVADRDPVGVFRGEQIDGPTGGDESGPNPSATVAGEIVALGAQRVWDELGYTGAGIIVAVVDTGIDPTHPDLADHIWTNLGEVADNGLDDDGNGYLDDTWGWDFCLGSNMPNGGSHGTQVAGQVAGDGTNGTVTGMAPDAELMALGIDCDTPSRSWEASDYAIENGAHIITQSYSWWWTDQPDYEAFRRQTDVELAAGVIHVNSAGNSAQIPDRPIPYNISTPGNCPPPWIHPDQTLVGGVSSILAVGNVSWVTDVIGESSSLGPSAWEDIRANTDPEYPYAMAPEYQDYPYENGAQMGQIKPDLSAYGNGTTATCPGPSYCGFSGTSSAAPHVSGALALMLEAYPEATPAELAEAVMTTAQHRGDPGKNNVYGTGLLQAYEAVAAVETGVVYHSHTFDDSAGGNGDLAIDPGEQVTMQITLRNVTDGVTYDDLQAVVSTQTPGITIHNHFATFPAVAPRTTVGSQAPHFSLTIDAGLCTKIIAFDLELRYGGYTRRTTFYQRVGDVTDEALIADDFESDLGWSADPGTATDGFWVREDPVGVRDPQNRLTNPEDDVSDPGATCWVTGNDGGGPDDDDVDGGRVILLSPPFGRPFLSSLDLAYDRWFYDNQSSANTMWVEFSNDGGNNWTTVEQVVYGYGGWSHKEVDLMDLLPPTENMRLRFVVEDGGSDGTLEGGVDEVHVHGVWVACQDFSPPAQMAPNPVGDSLRVEAVPGGHARLLWQAPPVDAGHDAATLYRIDRAIAPEGPFQEIGTASSTRWVDVDAGSTPETHYYRVRAENQGGGE